MSSSLYWLALPLLVFGTCFRAEAQGTSQGNSQAVSAATHLEQVPRVPGVSTLLRGFNAGVTFSGVHDSSIGWYNVVTLAAGYSFSPHFSADTSVSIYPYRLVQNQNPEAPDLGLVTSLGDIGDTFIGLHASFNPSLLRNTTTASFTIPSGDRSTGLGAGKVTFDFSDHMERTYKQTEFLVDMGAGDSSGLFNRLVMNDYTSVGALAHFQGGLLVWLFGRNYLQSIAYEQRPIGTQTLYINPGPPGFPQITVVSGSNVSEDHGITSSAGIPLNAHLTLSGYYNRSFKQNLDTVSVGVTYVLRGNPRYKRMSLIDKAIREAEGAGR